MVVHGLTCRCLRAQKRFTSEVFIETENGEGRGPEVVKLFNVPQGEYHIYVQVSEKARGNQGIRAHYGTHL